MHSGESPMGHFMRGTRYRAVKQFHVVDVSVRLRFVATRPYTLA